MTTRGIHIEKLPDLNAQILIAGFGGWGNALDISRGMAVYLIQKLKSQLIASVNPDILFRYDILRPEVDIVDGALVRFTPPSGSIYAVHFDSGHNDILVLEADEPHLQWNRFAEELFSICRKLGVKTVITLGSMYDNVLHSDRIISGIASNLDILSRLKQKGVIPVSYQGPSAIHSTLQFEGVKLGFQCISLWCHCPYYLQNTKHFGLMSHLADVLSFLGGFELDTRDLEERWEALEKQIGLLIENSGELQTMIDEIRKAKVRGTWESMKKSTKGEKVINLTDFLPPR